MAYQPYQGPTPQTGQRRGAAAVEALVKYLTSSGDSGAGSTAATAAGAADRSALDNLSKYGVTPLPSSDGSYSNTMSRIGEVKPQNQYLSTLANANSPANKSSQSY